MRRQAIKFDDYSVEYKYNQEVRNKIANMLHDFLIENEAYHMPCIPNDDDVRDLFQSIVDVFEFEVKDGDI